MVIPALACSVEVITVDSQHRVLRRGALLTDPVKYSKQWLSLGWGRNRLQIAGDFRNLDDSEAGLREILAAPFAHVELEAAGSTAIFAAANPRGRRVGGVNHARRGPRGATGGE